MTRRRRRVHYRTVSQRVQLWDKKEDPNVYAVYLEKTKPLALDKFTHYQAVHEELIRIVKECTSKYDTEYSRTHAYMWYAQGLWYISNRYSGETKTIEASALFVYFVILGLNSDLLLDIAHRLGIEISTKVINERLGRVVIRPAVAMIYNLNKGYTSPLEVTSTKPILAFKVSSDLQYIAYIEGIHMIATNPSGSGVKLYFRPVVYTVPDEKEHELTDWFVLLEGQDFDDWLRWINDAIPNGVQVKEVRLYAFVDKEPSPDFIPKVLLRRVTGIQV